MNGGSRFFKVTRSRFKQVGENRNILVRELERFLAGAWEAVRFEEAEPDHVLATVLFTDIVGSTAKAAELGDRAWRELLQQHNAVIRRQLVRFRGSKLDTAGDGFFASIDGPARAIRCARAIVDSFDQLGIHVRAGLHTGECEVFEGKIGGIAVGTGRGACVEHGRRPSRRLRDRLR